MRNPHYLFRVTHLHLVYFFRAVNYLNVLGGLTLGAFDFFVSAVAHQDDVVVALGETHRLLVHFGYQRAGGVNGGQVAGGGLLMHCRGHAVG